MIPALQSCQRAREEFTKQHLPMQHKGGDRGRRKGWPCTLDKCHSNLPISHLANSYLSCMARLSDLLAYLDDLHTNVKNLKSPITVYLRRMFHLNEC